MTLLTEKDAGIWYTFYRKPTSDQIILTQPQSILSLHLGGHKINGLNSLTGLELELSLATTD